MRAKHVGPLIGSNPPSPRETSAGAFCGDRRARKSSPDLATLCQLSVSNRFCELVVQIIAEMPR